MGELSLLGMAVDAFAVIGEWDLVAELHEPNLANLRNGAVWRFGLTIPQAVVVAVTCRALGAAEEAESYYKEAHRVATDLGGAQQSAETDRLYALALIDLGSEEDRERGRELLDAAADGYALLGLDHWASTVRSLR
jgi:hypothetical protein